jgi:AcrR family transcriptional regulator
MQGMPKQVDHQRRRRELAEAVCAVIAREGLEGASLRAVAEQAGWSIGSMRYYFATKAELLAFGLRHAAERIERRIEQLPEEGTPLERLRAVLAELLPLDAARREEALVWLAFLAGAVVDPGLAPQAEDVWRQLNEPLVRRVGAAIEAGELPARLDAEREGIRLQALVDGLVVHLLTAPESLAPTRAMAVVDDHLAALRGPGGSPSRSSSSAEGGAAG